MRILPSLLIISLISPLSAVEIRVATFNIGAHFGETFFDYSLGDQGTPDHDSVKAVLDPPIEISVVCQFATPKSWNPFDDESE